MASPVGLSDQELSLLTFLLAHQGRVVTRTQLTRDMGLRSDQRRRIDVMLVNVRRELAERGEELINVRSRGWMVPSPVGASRELVSSS